jgi:hypothetical protein
MRLYIYALLFFFYRRAPFSFLFFFLVISRSEILEEKKVAQSVFRKAPNYVTKKKRKEGSARFFL